MPRRKAGSDPSADIAYLRPLIERLGAEEVHRLVELCAIALADESRAAPEGGDAG